MPSYSWSEEKNKLLIKTRRISFEQVVKAIKNDRALTELPNPSTTKYRNQKLLIVIINNYTYAVPFVKKGNNIFFKTIYPSRKHHKQYKKGII